MDAARDQSSNLKDKRTAGAAVFFATGCYSGYFPGSPGTCGTLACFILWFLALRPFWDSLTVQGITLASLILLGFWSTKAALPVLAGHSGSKQDTDPQCIVIDEWAGMVIALLGVPFSDIWVPATAFLLFRAFDILKPYPISRAERLPGATGIMLDDIVAGACACGVVHLLLNFV